LFDLLHAMGEDLGFKYDKRDLDKLSYAPQGWSNDETTIRTIRQFAIEVMSGQRAVSVAAFAPNPKFPPAPHIPDKAER
jgi:hypothetical protein